MKICIQSGHEGRTSGATGAPGEQEFTRRIANTLAEKLRARGITVYRLDADVDTSDEKEALKQDFDLFLAIHGDADVYNDGGGFVDFPEPSTDGATKESQRIAKAIESQYFDHTGIVNHPERSNKNTRYYYMWSQLSLKTPCVIVECGVMQNAHDKVILSDTERVANALLRGVLKAFDIPYEENTQPSPAPTPPITDDDTKKLYELHAETNKRVDENGNKINDNSEEIKRLSTLLTSVANKVTGVDTRLKSVENIQSTLSGQLGQLTKTVEDMKKAQKSEATPEPQPDQTKKDNPFIKIIELIFGG